MIKEKREKSGLNAGASNATTIKEEPIDTSHNKTTCTTDSGSISKKKDDDSPISSCSIKKESISGRGGANGNVSGNVIGSNSSGSITSHNTDRKPETCNMENTSEDMQISDEAGSGNTSCNQTVKTEESGSDMNSESFSTLAGSGPMNVPMGIPRSSQQAPTTDGIQPLPSNVINKQPSSMELQYMQQQSQIFVFSTTWANRGAEAVYQGQFQSIIAYHCAQPGTKKYLEKHPLKMTQFNRQNHAQWLNNLAMMKNKGNMRAPGMMGQPNKLPANMPNFPGHPDLSHPEGDMPWDQGSNLGNLDGIANGGPNLLPDGSIDVPPLDGLVPESPHGPGVHMSNSGCPSSMGQSPIMTSTGPGSPSLSNLQPSLQGVKVPDENLTPQQRQHREVQLATIRKMQQMLFPEQGMTEGGLDGNKGPLQPDLMQQKNQNMPMCVPTTGSSHGQMQGGPLRAGVPPMGMQGGPGHAGPNMPCRPMGPGIVPGGPMSGGPMDGMPDSMGCGPMPMGGPMMGGPMGNSMQQNQMNNMSGMMDGIGGPMCGPIPAGHMMGGPGGISPCVMGQKQGMLGPGGPPNSVAAQLEWQKLQNQFFEDRKGKVQSSMGSPVNQSVGPGPGSGNRPTGRGNPQGQRSQGPPPPYHQTQRSASVPIAIPSPNPSSPNNPTSNLSLPSPRAGSALNSPADNSRQFSNPSGIKSNVGTGQSPNSQDSPSGRTHNPSNPGTPISSHMSPSASIKDLEFPPTSQQNQTSVDGMFGRSLQSLAPQKNHQTNHGGPPKEPNLMPVPSPQQIQYIGTFEGQELTIQKQPNTSLKDNNMISPNVLPTTMDGSFPGSNNTTTESRLSGPNTPLTPCMETRFPIPQSPQTPGNIPTTSSSNSDKNARLPGSGPSPQGAQGPQTPASDAMKTQPELGRFNASSPGLSSMSFPSKLQSGQMKLANFMEGVPHGKNMSGLPPGSDASSVPTSFACGRADNMPLNPNSSIAGGTKPGHFDPISSLAQMSQQLTNSVSSLNGQPGNSSGMMPFNSHPMMMGPGEMGMSNMGDGPMQNMGPMDGPCNMPMGMGMGMQYPNMQNTSQGMINTTSSMSISPKLCNPMGPGHGTPFPSPLGPRMARPNFPPGQNPYNGANIQVKASAPNTIQYLPARPQVSNSNPRAPPSLDFLHRFANPLNNMDGKMSGQNAPHNFPGYPGPMGGMPMGPGPGHMDGMGDMGPMMGVPGGMMGQGMVMRGMRPQGNMMRMPHMGNVFNGPNNGPDQMFPGPNMGQGANPQMFVAGSKSSPMGLGAPDASQPLPPSMGQASNFKSSQFVGPTTADPNYAQQFHNFQQQLYATTSTRSQLGQGMPPNQYFVPK